MGGRAEWSRRGAASSNRCIGLARLRGVGLERLVGDLGVLDVGQQRGHAVGPVHIPACRCVGGAVMDGHLGGE
jgi:hypothetical protein